jgi:hypothetical protein
MLTGLRNDVPIEDLRNHPAEILVTLQTLLAGDAKITPDPKRAGFYEVESGVRTFYIHISPVTGRILLLATWPNEDVPRGAGWAA